MKFPFRFRIDPSIGVSLLAAGLFVGAYGASGSFGRTIASLIEIVWLYLSNTAG